eukprot:TRINITY_DN34023_c0_g1_i6.p4 TRINITY_DN34023_c0_g1~~TRINITY_DN34023_c0_g1_i6.p4  ORF type:complete len:158 (-),score=19.94 TRINITY_DN34023_c0_g1_i6:251-724(-)
MTSHAQYVTVRNERGQEMLDSIKHRLEMEPTVSGGSDRRSLVMGSVNQDWDNKEGINVKNPLPVWLGTILAWILNKIGPKGIDFAKYSIEYHYLRNYIYVMKKWSNSAANRHIPSYVWKMIDKYDNEGEISKRIGKNIALTDGNKQNGSNVQNGPGQ